MKNFLKPLYILTLILFLAGLLRLHNLGKVPQSLNWDEVSLGYNANSILHTGKDEYGKFMPVVLRSYDDYKPALYTYLDIPFVGVLGLTEQAVRLPSAISGIAAVGIVYFLVLYLFNKREVEIVGKKIRVEHIALLTSFFLAISPWHIQFSRIAFESNVGLTINLLSVLFFFKGLKSPKFFPIAFFLAALNIHMYQSERVFSPLLMLVLSLIFFKKLLESKKWVIVSLIIAFVTAMPLLIYILNNKNALLRAKGVSVFSEQTLVARSSTKLLEDAASGNGLGKILDNRRLEYGKAVIAGYLSHYDFNWLFITGDIARHHAPFVGLLYIFEMPLILVGIYQFIFLKIDKKYKLAFASYFFLVPIPASVTSGVPHAVRTLNFEWTFELFAALGCISILVFIFHFRHKPISYIFKAFLFVYFILALLNISYYLNQYFVQLNYYYASDWLYGYKEAIHFVDSIRSNYDKVIVENEVPFDQSYMFFLFYLNVDPSYYQKLGGTNSGGFKEEHKGFYNYSFMHLASENVQGKKLLMGKPNDFGAKSTVLKTIYNPDGSAAITIGEK